MKTTMIFFLLSFSIIEAHAQQDSVLVNKNNRRILPEKSDIAIGFNANSIFNYLGDIFNDSRNNSLRLSLLDNSQLFFKHFLAENTAVNVRFSVNMTNQDMLYYVNDGGYFVNLHEKYSRFGLSTGYEKHRGKSRLQLVYGGEVDFSYSDVEYKDDYPGDIDYSLPKEGFGFGITLRGFAGVEYFVAPKISIGGQCGLGIEGAELFPKKYSQKILVNTDSFGGQVYMLFHFEH